jgi:hypothetical protein
VGAGAATGAVAAIPPDVRDTIKGTKLDTGVYLDSLKGMEPGWVFGGNLLLSH